MTNAEIALRLFDGINAGDFDAIEPIFHPEIVLEYPFPLKLAPAEIRGAETVLPFMRRLPEMFRYFKIYATEVHDCPSRNTVIVYAISAAETLSGEPYQNTYGSLLTFQDGRIVRWREYSNPDSANRMLAGLEHQS